MNDLFSEDPAFRRVQYTKISDNVQNWPQEISALVAEHLPRELGLSVSVVFQKVDEQKGYAIGTAIAVSPQTRKSIGVPIVIKAFHAAPFDMFFREGKLVPLTQENMAKAFYSSDLGAGVASQKPPPNLQDDDTAGMGVPPMGGKYASVRCLNDAISGTCSAEDVRALRRAVDANPAALAKFASNGTVSILKKWASEAPKASSQDEADDKRAVTALTVKKDGINCYRIYASNDRVFEPMLVHTDRPGLISLLGTFKESRFLDSLGDPMLNVDKNGEVTLTAPESPYGKSVDGPAGKTALGVHRCPFVFDPLQDDRTVTSAEKFGRYAVRDKAGVLAKGFVFPRVVTLDGGKATMKLFLGQAMAAMQSRIAGVAIPDEPGVDLPVDEPEPGKIGSFVFLDGKEMVATVPVEIRTVTVLGGEKSIGVTDYKGGRANLIPSQNVKGIVPLASAQMLGPLGGTGKNYLLSREAMFVRMPRFGEVSAAASDFKKLASDGYLDPAPLKVSRVNGHYLFRGGQIAKYASASDPPARGEGWAIKRAFDFSFLPRHEAAFLLGAWGLGQEKIATVLDGSRNRIVLEVHHLRYPDLPQTAKTAMPRFVQALRGDMEMLVKSASMLEDADTVDAVLGLGFLNAENLDRFAAVRPMLEETGGVLAKLLLAARLGMADIPEEAVRAALLHLQKVMDGISQLGMRAEQEKTSAERRKDPNVHQFVALRGLAGAGGARGAVAGGAR